MQKIKKGDDVIVITGKDKGKRGNVVSVLVEDDRVIGSCPGAFYGLMHIRELGILDISKLKSEQYVTDRHSIDMIIELVKPATADFQITVIAPRIRYWHYDNIAIPGLSLSCGTSRNISLVVKAAILQYALR